MKKIEQKSYAIKFTPLAEAIADRHGGVEALEEQIRKELLPPWGPSNINKLFFHVVAFGGSHFDEAVPNFLCKPSKIERDVLLVDASAGAIEVAERITDGPFEGMRVLAVPEAFDN